MEKIIELFNDNPTQKEVHTTSDGYNFWDAHFAEAHARGLDNKDVTTTTRKEAEAAVTAAVVEILVNGTEGVTETPAAPAPAPAAKAQKTPKAPKETVVAPAAPATEPAKEPVKEEPAAPAETPNTEV